MRCGHTDFLIVLRGVVAQTLTDFLFGCAVVWSQTASLAVGWCGHTDCLVSWRYSLSYEVM